VDTMGIMTPLKRVARVCARHEGPYHVGEHATVALTYRIVAGAGLVLAIGIAGAALLRLACATLHDVASQAALAFVPGT
jgi:hypothetical protein